MKKIMFNDTCGLTQAVLDGTKTMTRRVITDIKFNGRQQILACDTECNEVVDKRVYTPRYHVGEVVAVAQPYKDVANTLHFIETCLDNEWRIDHRDAGWNNKMFVRAVLMPHQIKITNIKVEQLQNISEDCLKEGVYMRTEQHPRQEFEPEYTFGAGKYHAQNPRAAFAALIDSVSGRGSWNSNPWVVAYSFELVK